MRRIRERGEGQFGCIVGLIFFLAVLFVAYKMIPVKVRTAELRGEIVYLARAAGTNTDKQIEDKILAKAKELELPLEKRGLEIRRGRDHIRVEANYIVPIEFPGYTFNWKQRHTASNPIF